MNIVEDNDWGMMSYPRSRKDKAHGGGTMLLWNQKKLTKINVDLPKQKGKLEWTAAAFKLANGHKIAVMSVYVAPDVIRKGPDRILGGLIEGVSRKVPGASILVGGDFNGCDHRIEMNHPQLSELQSPPTWPAVNPTRKLDLVITDVPRAFSNLSTSPGLKHNDTSVRSDHMILGGTMDAKKITQKPKHRETFEFRAGGEARREDVIKAIRNAPWSNISSTEGAEAKANAFMSLVLSILNRHRPWRRGTRRGGDPPWMTEGLKRMVQNKSTEYKKNGYSERFKRLRKATEKAVKARRKQHFQEFIQKMLQSDPATFYRKFKELFELSEHAGWTPYDAVPEEEDKKKAREIMADFFSNISQEYPPLRHDKLPHDDGAPVKVKKEELAEILKIIKVPGGSVDGDIDAETMRACAETLAGPLSEIFDAMFNEGHWPSCWKDETCIILPKKPGAAELGKTRPISMTPMWSKIGERVLWSFIDKKIGHLQSKYQFGARKGIGATHMMSLVLHNLLLADDNPKITTAMMGFDLQKAFNRGRHADMLDALKAKGLPNWTINTMAAFLTDRKLKVKVGKDWSTERSMPGGIGQGTIGGPSLFTLLTEPLDDAISCCSTPSAYIDDRSAIVELNNEAARITEDNGQRQIHHDSTAAQVVIDRLQTSVDELGMKLNGMKTEVVIFDKRDKSTNHIDLQTRDGPIREMPYEDSFKLVGWTFKRSLDASAHVKAVITKANQKKFVIRRLRGAGVGKRFLVRAYVTFVRPCIEYLSVVYDALITKEECGLIETCQRDFLKCIYGHKTPYKELLLRSGLERLESRRHRAVVKFCEKVKADLRFDWFDQEQDERLRTRMGARPPRIKKEATRKSPIHHFRRVIMGEVYKAEHAMDKEDDLAEPQYDAEEQEQAIKLLRDIQAWYHPEDTNPYDLSEIPQ